MKTILLFISGMASAAILVIATLFFLLHEPKVPEATSPRNAPNAEYVYNPADQISITGTVVMPPEIKLYRPHTGVYRAHFIFSPNFKRFVDLGSMSAAAEFPRNFEFRIERKKFEEMIKDAQGWLAVSILYLPNVKALQNGLFPYYVFFEPAVMGYYKIPAGIFQQKTNEFHLGKIRFDTATTPPPHEKCRADLPILEGTITPPSQNQQKPDESKFALVVYPSDPTTRNLTVAKPGDFEKNVLHYQYLDFSHGAAKFTVPPKPSAAFHLSVMVVRCRASEDLKACAQVAFPPRNATYNGERVFKVRNPNYEIATCGQKGYQGHLVSYILN